MARVARPLMLGCILPIAFMTSCVCFIPSAFRIADPKTHHAVDEENLRGPFPIVVVNGQEARIEMVEDPWKIPAPASGASYLIPIGRRKKIERSIREQDTTHQDSSWVLNVQELSPGRQEIELFLMGDGYWGGAYEATATTIVPLYRKVTGPGFALVAGRVALLMNLVLWAVASGVFWIVRRRRRLVTDGGTRE